MTDATLFEARLTEALGRYSDRVSVDVDPDQLVGALATTAPRRRRTAVDRSRLALAIVLIVAASLAGIALFGGRLVAPTPLIVPSPSPLASTATPTTSTSPVVSPSPTATHAASLDWTERDIGTQPEVTSIWRVGEWFIAVGPAGSFAGDVQHVDAQFIRSRDGIVWEKVPAPARGMEVETGTVDGGVLWIVGSLGTSAEPKRGIWTTSDGATWRRVADVKGLDFGPGGITAISHARAGWLALASRWIDAESQEGFMLRSTDGIGWSRTSYPAGSSPYDVSGLVSDGAQWLLATVGYEQGQPASIEALTSGDGLVWTTHVVDILPKPGGAGGVAFGPRGFAIVGQMLDGEYPHPVAWSSSDGTIWTEASMVGRPDPAGQTGLRSVVAFDGGYFASGYRLDDIPTFWSSVDGSSWYQIDDPSATTSAFVNAIGASDTTFLAGGQASSGGGFIWSAAH